VTPVIRPATLTDAGGIATVQVRSWQAAYRHILSDTFLRSLSIASRTARWDTVLREHASQTYVAELSSEVIGWITVGQSRDTDAPPTAGELWAIYVAPEHWDRGAGRTLWARGRSHLEAAGFLDVIVWVLADNRRGLRFYEAAGFAHDPGGERMLEIGSERVREIRLRRPLAS
jgi:ribosomal protein S18 acetylase RimI-like enzyme